MAENVKMENREPPITSEEIKKKLSHLFGASIAEAFESKSCEIPMNRYGRHVVRSATVS